MFVGRQFPFFNSEEIESSLSLGTWGSLPGGESNCKTTEFRMVSGR